MRTITLLLFYFSVPVIFAQPVFVQANRFAGANDGTVFNILVETDKRNQMYLCGRYWGPVDFDLGPAQYTMASSGFFVCKYDHDGDLLWARSLSGGGNMSRCSDLTVDSDGNVLVTGDFDHQVDFDPGAGVHALYAQPTYPPNWGASGFFVCKLDSNGHFVFAKGWDGPKIDHAESIGTDGYNNIYISGFFTDSLDMDPDTTTFMSNTGNEYNTFLLKLTTTGQLVWSQVLDGNIRVTALQADAYSHVDIAGGFIGSVDFDPGNGVSSHTSATGATSTYTSSGFIARFDQQNGSLMVVKVLPPGFVEDLASGEGGDLLYSGQFLGGDFDPGPGVSTFTTSFGNPDIFFGKLDGLWEVKWTKQLQGSGHESRSHIDSDSSGNILILADIQDDCDLDPGAGSYTVLSAATNSLATNSIISKFDANGQLICGEVFGTSGLTWGQSVAIDNIGRIRATIFLDDTSAVSLGLTNVPLGQPTHYLQSSLLVQTHCGDIITTGLPESAPERLSVFPVPTTGKVHITNRNPRSEYMVTVYSAAGAPVKRIVMRPADDGAIDLGVAPVGFYFATIESGGISQVVKVIRN